MITMSMRKSLIRFLALCLTASAVSTARSVYDFYVIENSYYNWETQRDACIALGYDGLAVVSSPEAYVQALQVANTVLQINDVFVGLIQRPGIADPVWEDNSTIATDTPLKMESNSVYGRIDRLDLRFTMASGVSGRYALCGNHKNLPREAYGSTTDCVPSGVKTAQVLQVTTTSTFKECVRLCVQDHRCKLAQYIVNTHSCTIIPPQGYDAFQHPDPGTEAQTFLRRRYEIELEYVDDASCVLKKQK